MSFLENLKRAAVGCRLQTSSVPYRGLLCLSLSAILLRPTPHQCPQNFSLESLSLSSFELSALRFIALSFKYLLVFWFLYLSRIPQTCFFWWWLHYCPKIWFFFSCNWHFLPFHWCPLVFLVMCSWYLSYSFIATAFLFHTHPIPVHSNHCNCCGMCVEPLPAGW